MDFELLSRIFSSSENLDKIVKLDKLERRKSIDAFLRNRRIGSGTWVMRRWTSEVNFLFISKKRIGTAGEFSV